MRRIAEGAARVLEALTRDLKHLGEDGAVARKVGREGGAFMQVTVERIEPDVFSVAHYYVQNGDVMRDPEMTFLRTDDGKGGHLFYALTFQQDSTGTYQVGATREGANWRVAERRQRDLSNFANTWMRNIKHQQADFFAGRAA